MPTTGQTIRRLGLLLAAAALAWPLSLAAKDRKALTPVAVRLVDGSGRPVAGAELRLMREANLRPVANGVTGGDGTARFGVADASGEFFVAGVLDPERVPPGKFLVDGASEMFLYLSPLFDGAGGDRGTIDLKLDWDACTTIRETDNRHFNQLFLRAYKKPRYLVGFTAPPTKSIKYLFSPMKKSFQALRAASDDVLNDYIVWWPFFALPGEVVNIY